MGNKFCCCVEKPLLDYDSDDELEIQECIDEYGQVFKIITPVKKSRPVR